MEVWQCKKFGKNTKTPLQTYTQSHPTHTHHAMPLLPATYPSFAAIGAVLWASGVVFVRAWPKAVNGGAETALTHAALVPVTYGLIRAANKLTGLESSRVMESVAVMCCTACLIDGVVITWNPSIYRDNEREARITGGTLLFAIGVGLGLGLVMNKSAAKMA